RQRALLAGGFVGARDHARDVEGLVQVLTVADAVPYLIQEVGEQRRVPVGMHGALAEAARTHDRLPRPVPDPDLVLAPGDLPVLAHQPEADLAAPRGPGERDLGHGV